MVKAMIFMLFILFISNAYSIQLSVTTETSNTIISNSRNDPSMGCTIRMKKNKNSVSDISFISEVQSQLGKGTFKKCK